MIPHPDAAPGNPGSMTLNKIHLVANGGVLFATFMDGAIHEIDLKNQRYNAKGNLYNSAADKTAYLTSHAHVVDGTTLKSFVVDQQSNFYLIKTDLTTSPFTSAAPMKIKSLTRTGLETPVATHMYTGLEGVAPRLLLISHGTYDSISYVDETTGEQEAIFSILSSDQLSQPLQLQCNEGTKDCDFWHTSCYDPVNRMLYYQAHEIDAETGGNLAVYNLGYAGVKFVTPYSNIAVNINFGYAAYQFVNMA